MTRYRKRRVWLVTDYGGEYEDAWEHAVRAFTSKEMAENCADKRFERADVEDWYWDYLGSSVEEIELIEEVPE